MMNNNENENVNYLLLRKRQWTSWPLAILYTTATAAIFRNLDFLDAFVILGALVFLLTQWLVDFKCFLLYSRVRDVHHATACKITMSAGRYTKLLPLRSRKLAGSCTDEFYFDLHKQRFIFSDGKFVMLPYPSHETFGYYLNTNGHDTEAKLQLAADKWGRNVFDYPRQTFQMLMKEHCMEPCFLLQVLCFLCLDGYVYCRLFVVFALFALESMIVHGRITILSDLSRIRVDSHMLMAFRCGKWISVSGTDLVPGDVVSVCHNGGETSVPADMLILAGSAIVSETILTGKSTPQRKVSIMGREPEEHLSFKRDKQHVLFCGTKILQHTQPDKTFHIETPDDGCLAFVLRTGFETKQGRLIQTILVSRDMVSANSWERGLLSLLFVVFAIIAASYQFKEGIEDPNWSRHKLLSKSSRIVTSLIPHGIPEELLTAVFLSFYELRRRDIYFSGPFGQPFYPTIHTGDRSSMISPSFIAGYPSVSITKYLIRERRATLVTTLQMLKILVLHCFAFTYVQCIMHYNGVKLGNILTIISLFITASFILSITDTWPLSACRLHHPHVFLSMLGQSALHMLLLILSMKEAKKHMPIKPESEFESNMLITVSFIASMTIQITMFAVNYLGHPSNISENKQFKCVLLSAVVFLTVITSSVSRTFNDLLTLVPLPSGLRDKLIIWEALMFFGCYAWESLLRKKSL